MINHWRNDKKKRKKQQNMFCKMGAQAFMDLKINQYSVVQMSWIDADRHRTTSYWVIMAAAINLTFLCLLAFAWTTNGFMGFSKRKTLLFGDPFNQKLMKSGVNDVTEEYITQRLDNFDPQNNGTFQMVGISIFHSCTPFFYTKFLWFIVCPALLQKWQIRGG